MTTIAMIIIPDLVFSIKKTVLANSWILPFSQTVESK